MKVYVFSSFQNAATQGSGSTVCLGCCRSPVLRGRGRPGRGRLWGRIRFAGCSKRSQQSTSGSPSRCYRDPGELKVRLVAPSSSLFSSSFLSGSAVSSCVSRTSSILYYGGGMFVCYICAAVRVQLWLTHRAPLLWKLVGFPGESYCLSRGRRGIDLRGPRNGDSRGRLRPVPPERATLWLGRWCC